MPTSDLIVSIIQPNIVWENREANLIFYEQLLNQNTDKKELVFLPEMFTTGFSMNPKLLAEEMDGVSVNWMKEQAVKHKIILCGSLIIKENECFYNRLIWMQPNGVFAHYDKRHLFSYAGENIGFTAGEKKLIVQVKGWKICLNICYDLRFPVWVRNTAENPYDILVYLANWPEKRIQAWNTLLQARAIENQCYTVGVNRVGKDGNEINYTGNSIVCNALGETLLNLNNSPKIQTIQLIKKHLTETRTLMPFLNDCDHYLLLKK